MRALLLTALAAAGCWTSTPPAAAPASPPTHAAPSGPVPRVRWIDNWLEAFDLPAVAADGARIVFAQREDDGGRGNPNLALVVEGRDGTVLERRVVMSPDEADTLFDASGMKPELRERIAGANQWLARLHATHDLRPLSLLDTHNDPQGGVAGGTAHGQGLHVEWVPSRLVIRHEAKVVVDTPTPASWFAPDRPTCDGCPPCSNPAYLAAAHADAERRVVLLTISYSGTDLCWEPNSQHHVVSW